MVQSNGAVGYSVSSNNQVMIDEETDHKVKQAFRTIGLLTGIPSDELDKYIQSDNGVATIAKHAIGSLAKRRQTLKEKVTNEVRLSISDFLNEKVSKFRDSIELWHNDAKVREMFDEPQKLRVSLEDIPRPDNVDSSVVQESVQLLERAGFLKLAKNAVSVKGGAPSLYILIEREHLPKYSPKA